MRKVMMTGMCVAALSTVPLASQTQPAHPKEPDAASFHTMVSVKTGFEPAQSVRLKRGAVMMP